MSDKFNSFTRRKFLLHLAALTPAAALIAIRGRFFGNLALAQGATPAATTTLDCIASPQMTEGPYFVDELLNRSDIRTDPTDNSVKPGIPLKLAIAVFSVDGNTCSPLKNAQIDIWHCDAAGLYSDEQANNTVGKKFLRGYQVTDDTGLVNFTTIYPGWYMGRTIHIHAKVRTVPSNATLSAATESAADQTWAFNTQIFFDDTLSDQVFTQAPYNARPNRSTRNATDGIFTATTTSTDTTSDGHDDGEKMLLTLTKNGDTYEGRLNIGVDLSQPSAQGGFGGPGGPGGRPGGPRPGGPLATATAGS
jgi:protocatechuate 3,4-dioxygenase beta subunit